MTRDRKRVLVNLMTGQHPLTGVAFSSRNRILGALTRSGHLRATRMCSISRNVTLYALTNEGHRVASRAIDTLTKPSPPHRRGFRGSALSVGHDRYGCLVFAPR